MEFFFLHVLDLEWKNFVFASPNLSQVIRERFLNHRLIARHKQLKIVEAEPFRCPVPMLAIYQ